MIKTIIFDFDGTIADSLPIAISVINTIGSKYKFPKITEDDIRNVGFSGLLSRYKVPLLLLPFFVREAKKEMKKHIGSVHPVSGIEPVLKELSKKYELGIVSSNAEEIIQTFLRRNNWNNYFAFIFSDSSLFGKHKTLLRLLKQRKINKNETIYIGDEERDIKAAKKASIRVISVLWGYESKKILEKHNPDFMANSPKELIDIIERKSNI